MTDERLPAAAVSGCAGGIPTTSAASAARTWRAVRILTQAIEIERYPDEAAAREAARHIAAVIARHAP